MEFLHSFLRRHLTGKPVVASPNVGCFLRLHSDKHLLLLQLQYYKQGKSDDFVKILEAARTGKSDTFSVSATYMQFSLYDATVL